LPAPNTEAGRFLLLAGEVKYRKKNPSRQGKRQKVIYYIPSMTALSMPEAIVVSVAMICITVFFTAVSLKGMDWKKKKE